MKRSTQSHADATIARFCLKEGPQLLQEIRRSIHRKDFGGFHSALGTFELLAVITSNPKLNERLNHLRHNIQERNMDKACACLSQIEDELVKTVNHLAVTQSA